MQDQELPRRAQGKGAAANKKKSPELAPDVQAAIDAVDRAVKLLPDEAKVNFTVYEQQEGGGWNQRGNDAPAQNPGSKVATCLQMLSTQGSCLLQGAQCPSLRC